MPARAKVFIDIVAKTTGTDLKKFAIGVGIAALAIAGLVKIGKNLVNIYSIQEQAEARLEQTIKSTGKAAGLTADQLKDMAAGLQGVTKFSDEAIIGAESLLLTFKDIGGDVFPRALESILDVSEAMGASLQGSAIQLGKALNDPIGGIAALTRVGIQFTDEQKNLIKSLVETGDKAAAQGIILDELESQFGGVAKAAADTATGALTQLGNVFGDLHETFGRTIAEGINPFVKGLTDIITQMVEAANKAHDLKEALEIVDEGGITTAKQTLLILENQRDKLGRIAAQYMGLDEAATTAWENAKKQIEDYNEALLLTDMFLIKATTTEERRNRVIDSNTEAIETYAQILRDAMTDEELRVIFLQNEIDKIVQLKSEAKTLGEKWSGLEILLIALIKEKNEILEDEIVIIDGIMTAEDVLAQQRQDEFEILLGREEIRKEIADAKRQADEDEADRIKKQIELYEDLAETGLTPLIQAFSNVGDAGANTWDVIKQAGKDSVSAILEALAKAWTVRAVASLVALDFVGSAGWFAVAGGAVAASSAIQNFATGGQFITDGPTLVGNKLIGDNASGQELVTVEPLGGADRGGSSRETFRLIGPGNELLGFIQRVGINGGKLHSFKGGRI